VTAALHATLKVFGLALFALVFLFGPIVALMVVAQP
jgi:hypothetical protein